MKKEHKAVKGQANCQNQIVNAIFSQVLNGTLKPGEQLPTLVQLGEQFDVTVVTIQRALKRLKETGLVQSTRGSGCYIVDDPAILRTFALVFPRTPQSEHFSMFWQALIRSAEAFSKKGFKFKHYYDIDFDHNIEQYKQLVDDAMNYRIGGIIFASHPFPLTDTNLLADDFHLPRVALMAAFQYNEIPAIYPDIYSFCQRSLDFLYGKNRRKIALILGSNYDKKFADYVVGEIRKRRVDIRPYWVQSVPVNHPYWAENCVQLLLSASKTDRPDAIILIDDHIVEPTVKGLADIELQEELDIIAFSNFPQINKVDVPISRIGFDVTAILGRCIKTIQAKRVGKPCEKLTLTPAVFDYEMKN